MISGSVVGFISSALSVKAATGDDQIGNDGEGQPCDAGPVVTTIVPPHLASVSAHLMPVYVHPELLSAISPALRRRMQGKACFNFKALDDALLAELGTVVNQGAALFARDGSLRPPTVN